MDEGVGQGNAEGQEPIADEAAGVVVFFAGPQMREFFEILKHEKERGQDGKEPGVIPVA